MKRPKHLDAPAYLSKSPPVPEPQAVPEVGAAAAEAPPAGEEERRNPTRYGDWEKKGIAIDF